MEIPRESRRAREINLIPLVDIILMLVIFFMISTSFVASESMELSLPSGAADSAAGGDVTRIIIQPTGDVTADDRAMDGNGLNAYLAQILASNIDRKIAIFTTPGVSVQQLVTVMDTVYLTGGRNVQVDKVEAPYGN